MKLFRGKTLFVTVGTTRFDDLIGKLLDNVENLGFDKVVLQVGNSEYSRERVEEIERRKKVELELYTFKSSIGEDIERADVIVGHAGAGTCLEALRANKKLLVVVNESLMDNHQSELADQLASDKYVVKTNVEHVIDNLQSMTDKKLKLNKFPPRDTSKFEEVFNEALRKVVSRL